MKHTFPYRVARLARLSASRILDAVAGHRCAACDAALEGRWAFCVPCAATVLPTPTGPRTPLMGAGEHGGALATAVHRLKYRDRPDLARPLGGLLARALPDLDADLVVPVPLHPRRLAARGYNQAGLLADVVAFELDLAVDPTALRRIRDTEVQAELGRADRQRNVEGAFRATQRVAGRRVLIVDDVATTGATLQACAEPVRAAGAQRVDVAAVALTSA